MVGKTIARVEQPGYEHYQESNLLVLWFTDGTAAKLVPTGYESDDIEITMTTAAELDAAFVESIETAIELEWDLHERALRKVSECRAMAEAYGGEDTKGYQRWYQNRYGMGVFAKALKSEFAGAMRDQMNHTNHLHIAFERGDHVA